MRDKTGRWIRGVILAVVSVSCVALLVGCDSEKDDPADEPSPSVVSEERSEDPSEDPFEDRSEDPDDTPNPRPTGDDQQSIAPEPLPPTASRTDDEDGPTSAPSLTPPVPPSPKAPVPPELPDPDGT
ncbi:hypothetical protein Q5762_16545 [Streptomyces sp. P9(2023)]|uniref:hypothetical protein n=1 Tax=Streptomyces sp. P9(2023) TaxID=3064394 RepID=UPI0028F451EE|nr:hypothetical protein [Streptomyces sp. P9(2023)]MDT9689921.1 hypothetical protein [Streptomyces sp. P9(2023)]